MSQYPLAKPIIICWYINRCTAGHDHILSVKFNNLKFRLLVLLHEYILLSRKIIYGNLGAK